VNSLGYRDRDYNYQESCHEEQKHVHELQGSVKTADQEDPHQHRFCTVTEEAMPVGDHDHVHEVCFRTDFFDGHFHEFKGRTGCAIKVGDRHVHYIESVTSLDDGHRHNFEAATLIENPTGSDYGRDKCEEICEDKCEEMREERRDVRSRRNNFYRR
jgi:hypothetical protein